MRPLFTPDWPRYAVAAHVVFWSSSALLLIGIIAGVAGAVRADYVLWLLAVWISTVFIVGVAALFSGKLYVSGQVFTRTPTTGWAARVYGAFVAVSAAVLMLLAYGVTHMRGV